MYLFLAHFSPLSPRPSNHFPRLSSKFRTPLKNSPHCSTRTSSLRFTGLPEVLTPTQQPLVRRSAGGVPPRSSCGVSVIGGSGRGGKAAFPLPSLTSRIVPVGNLAEIRKIQVRILSSTSATQRLPQAQYRSRARMYVPILAPCMMLHRTTARFS